MDKKTNPILTPDWATKLRDFMFGRGALEKAAGGVKTPVQSKIPQDSTALQAAVAESMKRKAEREAEASVAAKQVLSAPKRVR